MTLFDEAVPRALKTARDLLGSDVELVVVRDNIGCVSVIVPDDVDAKLLEPCAARLHDSLGAYSPGLQAVLLRHRDLINPTDVLDSPYRVAIDDASNAFLVDRVITNQDWVRKRLPASHKMRIATGYSIKGGVGRTTALAVWARHLAQQGKHVVLVDLDLEAPGLASLLLSTRPAYGLVDWLAEDLVGQADAIALDDVLAASPIANDASGSVRVLPAFGDETKDYVSKLGRVLVPTLDADDTQREFAARLERMLSRVAESSLTDAILLDARAGLHDLGAAAVTQLGAQVFLFARNEVSGWDAWRKLFEQLRMSRMIQYGGPDDDLRWRLKMVGAQLGVMEADRKRFLDDSFDLWTSLLYDEAIPSRDNESPLTFEPADTSAPHYPLTIVFDPALRGIGFANPDERPDARVLDAAFGEFCAGATSALFDDEEGSKQ